MPSYSQQQHSKLAIGTGRRGHLNRLLEAQCLELERIYGADQLPTFTLGGRKLRTAPAAVGYGTEGFKQSSPTVTFSADTVEPVSPSRELALQVSGKRTPSGNFFSTINPTLFEKDPPPSRFQGRQSVTQVALHSMRSSGQADTTSSLWNGAQSPPATPSQHASAPEASVSPIRPSSVPAKLPCITSPKSETKKPAPWLMPWQTGDRETGRKMADAIRNKRTPIGAFANLDLAKANK